MVLEDILIIEDEPDDQTLIKRAFKKNKISNKIIIAEDANIALDMLLGRNNYFGNLIRPKFILMDLKMPKMNGLELLKILKSNKLTKYIPIIVFTSSNEEQDLIKSYEIGANSFIKKPIDFEELNLIVGKIAEYWLRMNHAYVE